MSFLLLPAGWDTDVMVGACTAILGYQAAQSPGDGGAAILAQTANPGCLLCDRETNLYVHWVIFCTVAVTCGQT